MIRVSVTNGVELNTTADNNGNKDDDTISTKLRSFLDLESKNIYKLYFASALIVSIIFLTVGLIYYSIVYHNDDSTADVCPDRCFAPSTPFLSFWFVMKTVIKIGYDDFVPTTNSGRQFTAWFILFGVCIGGAYIAFAANYIQLHKEKRDAIRNKELIQKIEPNMNRTKSISQYLSTLRKSLSRSTFNDDDEMKVERISSRYGLNEKEEKSILDLSSKAFDTELRQLYIKIATDIFIIAILIVIGMLVMMGFEKWHPADAFYFSVVTISSIGYGDFIPTTDGARIFVIFYVVVGGGYLIKSCYSIVTVPLILRSKKLELKFLQQFYDPTTNEFTGNILPVVIEHPLVHEYINILKVNEDITTKAEFVVILLLVMNRINEKDMIRAFKIFDKLDKDDKKLLSTKEIIDKIAVSINTNNAINSNSNSNGVDIQNPINV